MTPGRCRLVVDDVRGTWKVSIRRACSVLQAERSSYHYKSRRPDRAALKTRIKEIAQALLIGMRSREVSWVLSCALGDRTRWRCGESGAAEDPRTVRQWMNRLDLPEFRCQPERLGRHMEKPRGFAEVQPRFDSVVGGLVDDNVVMRAQRGDALTRPAITIVVR